MALLRLLDSSEFRYSEIMEHLATLFTQDVTLARHLKELEQNGLIQHNHLSKTYISTKEGGAWLNDNCKRTEEEYIAVMCFIYNKDFDLVTSSPQ